MAAANVSGVNKKGAKDTKKQRKLLQLRYCFPFLMNRRLRLEDPNKPSITLLKFSHPKTDGARPSLPLFTSRYAAITRRNYNFPP